MAKTYVKDSLLVNPVDDPLFTFLTRRQPEGASQTFPGGAPLVAASGLLVEATSPLNPTNEQVTAFSLEAAHNEASGATIACVLASPFLPFEANFLGAAAADNVLAAADLFASAGLAKSTTLIGGADPGWYLVDGGTAAAVIKELTTIHRDRLVAGDNDGLGPAAGDTNARVRATLLESAVAW